MENASKALIIAAEVLIGIIIISIGVALFNMFQAYSKDTVEQINESKLTEFNNNFLKYYGKDESENGYSGVKRVSAHDIISLANFAAQNNKNYDLTDVQKNELEYTMYVRVDIKNSPNVEKWNEETKNKFIKENSLNIVKDSYTGEEISTTPKYYQMTQCEISKKTKRVCYVLFEPIP